MTSEPRPEDSASVTILQKLNDGIRQNPVGAALVGLGIVWMLAGTSGMAAAVRAPAAAARDVPRRAHRAAEAMGEGATHVASAVRHVAGGAAGVVGDAARATMHPIGRTAESTAAAVGEGVARFGSAAQGAVQRATGGTGDATYAQEQARSVQETATHTVGRIHREFGAQLQAHPLLIGGIGLAIGAGLAALFPRTAIEARVMGEAADNMRARVGEMSGVAAGKVEDTVREIGAEAREIGVAARAAAEDVAQKARSAAAAGRDVITSRIG